MITFIAPLMFTLEEFSFVENVENVNDGSLMADMNNTVIIGKVSGQVKAITVDSAFNELGYNEIFEFLNIHFFKTDFS